MSKRFKISQAASFLYSLDVRYHAFAVISKGKEKLYDGYKVDFITDDQKAAILKACPDCQFFGAYKEYAPELRGVYICFPKAAYYRQAV